MRLTWRYKGSPIKHMDVLAGGPVGGLFRTPREWYARILVLYQTLDHLTTEVDRPLLMKLKRQDESLGGPW